MLKALASLIIIALTGCGSTSSSTPSAEPSVIISTVTASSSPSASVPTPVESPSLTPTKATSSSSSPRATAALRESVYLQLVHQRIPQTKMIPDAKLVSLGKKNCATFDDLGFSNKLQFNQYVINFHKGVGDVMSLSDTAWYMGVVIAAFCPKYDHIVRGG